MLLLLFRRIERWADQAAADKNFVWKLFLIALVFRAGLIFLHSNVNLISDMLGYHESGMSLLENGELRVKGRLSATRPPLYPIFIYLVYYMFGAGNIFALRLLQTLIGSFTVLLTFKLAEKIFSSKAALWAGLLLVLYPAAWGYCDLVLSETLFTFLFVAGLYFLVDLPQGKISQAFNAGVLLGLATLTRTVLYQFSLFFSVTYLIFSRRRFSYLPKLAIFVISFWVVLLPWLARNQRVLGKPILTTKSGVDFFLHNHSPLKFILLNYSQEDEATMQGIKPWALTELERDNLAREAAVKWIKGHPLLFLFKGVRMEWNFFGTEREYVWSIFGGFWGRTARWQTAVLLLVFAPTIFILMPLFIWGVVYGWKEFPLSKNLLLIIAYFLVVTFVYYGFSRHRFPLNPVMMIFGGYAITQLPEIIKDLKPPGILRRPRVSIALGLLTFFAIGWALEIVVDFGSLLHVGFELPEWRLP